jgi:hypothetical protein
VCKILKNYNTYFQSDLEKYYMIDMAGMAMWSGKNRNEEAYFYIN